jgi:hypothetical protein
MKYEYKYSAFGDSMDRQAKAEAERKAEQEKHKNEDYLYAMLIANR